MAKTAKRVRRVKSVIDPRRAMIYKDFYYDKFAEKVYTLAKEKGWSAEKIREILSEPKKFYEMVESEVRFTLICAVLFRNKRIAKW